MKAVTQADLNSSFAQLGITALRIKAERDQYEIALRRLIAEADLMLEPMGLTMPLWVEGYIREVKRVAEGAL